MRNFIRKSAWHLFAVQVLVIIIGALIGALIVGCQNTPGDPEHSEAPAQVVEQSYSDLTDYIRTSDMDAVAKTIKAPNAETLEDVRGILQEARSMNDAELVAYMKHERIVVKTITIGELNALAYKDADISDETRQTLADACTGSKKCELKCGNKIYIVTGIPDDCSCAVTDGASLTITCSGKCNKSKYLACTTAQ